MELRTLEVYSEDTNYAVIKPPDRNFPGAVIQGDSLSILCNLAVSIARRVRDGAPQDIEFLGDLEDLVESLVGRLLHYQQVLQSHNIHLPYARRLTEADCIRLVPDAADR